LEETLGVRFNETEDFELFPAAAHQTLAHCNGLTAFLEKSIHRDLKKSYVIAPASRQHRYPEWNSYEVTWLLLSLEKIDYPNFEVSLWTTFCR